VAVSTKQLFNIAHFWKAFGDKQIATVALTAARQSLHGRMLPDANSQRSASPGNDFSLLDMENRIRIVALRKDNFLL
jgi:hypothetical protein